MIAHLSSSSLFSPPPFKFNLCPLHPFVSCPIGEPCDSKGVTWFYAASRCQRHLVMICDVTKNATCLWGMWSPMTYIYIIYINILYIYKIIIDSNCQNVTITSELWIVDLEPFPLAMQLWMLQRYDDVRGGQSPRSVAGWISPKAQKRLDWTSHLHPFCT